MKYPLSYSIIFCSFIFVSLNAFGQDYFISAIDEIKVIESDSIKLEKYNAFLIELEQDKYPEAEGLLLHELGKSHSALGYYDQSLEFFLKAIEIRKHLYPMNLEEINESRYALSQVYKKLLRTDEQNQLLNEIIKVGRKDIVTCRAYSDIGRNIAMKGDYDSALQYLNTVLADAELMKEVDHEMIIRLKITMVYALKYQYVFKAEKDSPDLKNLKKHQLEIEKKLSHSTLRKNLYYGFLNNLAVVSEVFVEGQITALDSYTKSLNYYKKQNDAYIVHLLLSNIATVHSKLGNYEKANSYYQKVIDNALDSDLIAAAYVNKSYFLSVDSTKKKIPYYFIAFDILLDRNNKTCKPVLLPTLKEIRSSSYESDFLTYLIDLASIFVQSYKESGDVSYLHSAKESIYLIDQLVSRIRYESLSQESKLYWIGKGVDTYMLGVEICHLLKLTDEAFYFMEKNKALLLQENIKTLQAKWELDIPNKTLEREYSLYYQRVDSYEKFLKHPDDLQIAGLYNQINKEYTAFMDSLEQEYPGYTKTKKQIQLISLDEALNKYVSDDKCFVEYILNGKDGYGIFCSSEEEILFKIPDVRAFQLELSTLKSYCTKSILNKAETSEFQKMGHSVFLKLFPFNDALEKLSGKQITVIADQRLNHIPFEALPVSIESDLAESYLTNFCEIAYLQSISVSEQIRQKENNPQFSLLGLAPYEFQLDGLSTLLKSKDALEDLSNFGFSKVLLEGDATKKNFLEEIGDYEIIHLNTHAGIDSFNLEPWIAFRGEKMGLNELYGKENQAELVVLDACKTNDGKLVSGEGILNLSRGFFYNGAQSVLASNWNVNEKSGNEIIKNFYNQLQKGKTKSKALQLAKIDYIKRHQYSEILPYYWAAYTITGSIDSIDLKSDSPRTLMLIALGTVGLILFLFYLIQRPM